MNYDANQGEGTPPSPTTQIEGSKTTVGENPFTYDVHDFDAWNTEKDGSNTWYASGLPKGLSMQRDSGKISGKPKEKGTFSIDVTTYDGKGGSAEKTYSLTVSPPSATGKYELVPEDDGAYTVSTSEGFTLLTINSGVTGFRYFNVSIQPIIANDGQETVIFVLERGGVQVDFSFVKADFDAVSNAGAGFNVKPGDIIKVYIVDGLSNNAGKNPVLLQQVRGKKKTVK